MLFFIFRFVTFNLLISLGILTIALIRILSSNNSLIFPVQTLRMRTDLILALYFFLIAFISLLLTPTYLPAVFELKKKSFATELREIESQNRSSFYNLNIYVEFEYIVNATKS